MPEDSSLKNLSFSLDAKSRQVIASFVPEGSTTAVAPDVFMQAIKAAGFGGYSLHQASLSDALAKYNSGKAFEMVIGEALDGKLSIRIDPDFMAAYLSCTPALGGNPVRPKDVLQAAQQRGITAELDIPAIDKALREGGTDVLMAKGKPPVPALDGKFEILFPFKKERRPRLDAHGLADFRELGEISTVHAGDKLVRLVLPTSGEPGKTVLGKPIPVKPGKKVAFASKLDGTALDTIDPNILCAAIDGCPTVLKDGASVDPVYTTQDVDLRTGNVSFQGTVHVRGDVQTDMTIKATGDIYVDGTVESASLEAEGDIVVKGGVIGGTAQQTSAGENAPAAIKCSGSFTAHFVQNAHVSAGNGIFIHDIAMLSTLTAGHQIVVGDEHSRKGDIIGGTTRAMLLVRAKNIGASSYVRTVVIVGADPSLHERLNATIQAREAAEGKLANIIKLLEVARSNPDRVPPESAKKAMAMRDAINAEIECLREDETGVQKEIELANGARVMAEKQVFGGAEIRIGPKCHNVTQEREGGIFQMNDEGELIFI